MSRMRPGGAITITRPRAGGAAVGGGIGREMMVAGGVMAAKPNGRAGVPTRAAPPARPAGAEMTSLRVARRAEGPAASR